MAGRSASQLERFWPLRFPLDLLHVIREIYGEFICNVPALSNWQRIREYIVGTGGYWDVIWISTTHLYYPIIYVQNCDGKRRTNDL